MDDPLPLAAAPALDADGRRRWRRALQRRMNDAELESAADVEASAEFDIGSFKDAFSRLRQGKADALRRWFVERDGERARRLAEALEIEPRILVDDLRRAAEPLPAAWHPAFPGVEPDAALIEPPPPLGAAADGALVEVARRGFDNAGDDHAILWLVGEPGSGRRTLAGWLAETLDAQVRATRPAEGWNVWQACARGRWLACVTPAEHEEAQRDRAQQARTWHMAPWRPADLRALIERLAAHTHGLSVDGAQAAHELCARWQAHPTLADGIARPATLIAVLGALDAEPTRALDSPGALLEATWGTIQARGGAALASHTAALLSAFWTARWLDPHAGSWWRMTRDEARDTLQRVGGHANRDATVAALLDELDRGRGRREVVERLRRALDDRGPAMMLAALERAGQLRTTRSDDIEAVDPEQATIWIARGLKQRWPVDFDTRWSRLGDPYWAQLAAALAGEGIKPIELANALRAAPARYAADRARGLIHAFDAHTSDALSRRASRALRQAFFDAVWIQLLALTHPVAEAGHVRWGRPPSRFQRTTLAVERVSRQFAAALPQLDGPHFAASLEARLSAEVRCLTAGVDRCPPTYHYMEGGDTHYLGLRVAHQPDARFPLGWPLTDDPDVARQRATCVFDLRVALFIPSQCAVTRPAQLPGFDLVGTMPPTGHRFDSRADRPLRQAVIGRWLRHAPPVWWAAIEARAQAGDTDAIDLLSGRRVPVYTQPTPSISSPEVRVIGLDEPLPDDLELIYAENPSHLEVEGEVIEALHILPPTFLRVPEPETYTGRLDWERRAERLTVDEAGPRVFRVHTFAEYIDTAWYQHIPRPIRRRWVGHGADYPGFERRWAELAEPAAGVFEDMVAALPTARRPTIYEKAFEPPPRSRHDTSWHEQRDGGPPLWALVKYAFEQRDLETLRQIEALARRWVDDAQLGGRPGWWRVAFEGWPRALPTRGRTRTNIETDGDLAWARTGRAASSGEALVVGLRALDALGHAAAVGLHRHGHTEALEGRWQAPALGCSAGWRRRRAFVAQLGWLWAVSWAALVEATDRLPTEAMAWTIDMTRHWVRLEQGEDWTLRGFCDALGERFQPDTWQREAPDWHRTLCRALSSRKSRRFGAHEGRTVRWPTVIEGLSSHLDATPPSAEVMTAALLVGVLATYGVPPMIPLPPPALMAWLDALAEEVADHSSTGTTPDDALEAVERQRKAWAGLGLVDRGDDKPYRALCRGDVPDPLGGWLRRRLVADPARLDRWLSEMAPEVYLGWKEEEDLLGCALRHRLRGVHALWASRPLRWRADTTLSFRHHYDEAKVRDDRAGARLWAWVLHAHTPDDPRITEVVRGWLTDDAEPLDGGDFERRGDTVTGGSRAMLLMVEDWRQRHTPPPPWFALGVRRVFASAEHTPSGSVALPFILPEPLDLHRRPLPRGLVPSSVDTTEILWIWLRCIGARDLRDACVNAARGLWWGTHPVLNWWLDEAPDPLLWQRMESVTASLQSASVEHDSDLHGLARACLDRLVERTPEAVIDWCVHRCEQWPTIDPAPFDDDSQLWGWHDFGVEALVEHIARHQPQRLPTIWMAWAERARTPKQRRWVLAHIGHRAEIPDNPDCGLAAEVLRDQLTRPLDTRADGAER